MTHSQFPLIFSSGDGVQCCLTHYLFIEVWDKDTLNRDDFMGLIMVPVSKLCEQTLCGWYPLGRMSSRDTVSGEIYLEITLKTEQVTEIYCSTT